MSKFFFRYAQNNAKYGVQRVAFSKGTKFFIHYAQNNVKYNVQRVAFLSGTQCPNLSLATRKIIKNIMLKGLLSGKERNVKNFPSLRAK